MYLFRWFFVVSSCLLFATVTGCATYGPSDRFIGMSRLEVIALLGEPRPTPNSLDEAQRLDFPRGPMGKHTYSLYFDENGRVSGFQQLLNEKNFGTIAEGMDVREVVERIGVSTDTFLIARNRGFVWNYRYENTQCKWFQIEFTQESKVRSAGYSIPPECRRRLFAR